MLEVIYSGTLCIIKQSITLIQILSLHYHKLEVIRCGSFKKDSKSEGFDRVFISTAGTLCDHYQLFLSLHLMNYGCYFDIYDLNFLPSYEINVHTFATILKAVAM